MRGLVAKNIEALMPEAIPLGRTPKTLVAKLYSQRKAKKKAWNKLSHIEKGKRRASFNVSKQDSAKII